MTSNLLFSKWEAIFKDAMMTAAAPAPYRRHLGRPEVDQVIRFLFLTLMLYGIVEKVRSGEVPGYQINADALRWLPAEG